MGLDLKRSGKTLLPPTDGRIAIGRKNARGLPEKLDYFIFTHEVDAKTDNAPVHKEMTEVMQKKYGATPRTIKVVLPFHHYDEVFYTSFTDWKSKLAWSCRSADGHTAQRRQRDGSVIDVPCDYENCKFRLVNNDPNKTTCFPNGILSVLMPDAPVTGGVWKFRTRAWGSVHKIQEALETIFNFRSSLLYLEVELSIVMEPQLVPDGKGGKQKQNVPVVQIKAPFSLDELAMGKGTVYREFKEISEIAKVRGNLADTSIVKALSNELSSPPSVTDETDVDNPEENAQSTQTIENISTEPNKIKESTSGNTSPSQDDADDLY